METAVITGSTRGLGYELAKNFRMHGFNVVISGTTDEGIARTVNRLKEIKGEGEVIGTVCNVTKLDEVEQLGKLAVEKFGEIDYWVNNAGVNQSYKLIWDLPEHEIDYILNTDLKGTINGSSVAVKKMMYQTHGKIYNVEGYGSDNSFSSGLSLYGTAKRAVTYFTDALANEVYEQDLPIIVGKLSPGIMITEFITSSNGELNANPLDDKAKNIYNILGDYPDIVAQFLVIEMISNKKNGKRIEWLNKSRKAIRLATSAFTKRDFFKDDD